MNTSITNSKFSIGRPVQKFMGYIDYIPIMLIAFLFVAETELKTKSFATFCQLGIAFICGLIFFALVLLIGMKKINAILIATILWMTLVYLKKCYLP